MPPKTYRSLRTQQLISVTHTLDPRDPQHDQSGLATPQRADTVAPYSKFYVFMYHLSHSVIWWTSHIGPHDTVTVRVFVSTGGRYLNKTLFSNCNNMSKNRYISDVLGSNFTPISMVSEDATTTPAKQLLKMGRARPRTRAYGFSPFQAAPAEDEASISNDAAYDINGEKTDDINGEKTDGDTDDINGDPLGAEEFLTHLFNLGCTQETVSIVESHLDQAIFAEIMKAPDAHAILSEQLKVTCGITRACLLYTSPSPRDATLSRMPSSA